MKYLVATNEMQGIRDNDFCFAMEGELVTFGTECDNEDVDGECGCRRSMMGINSLTSTTTMKVAEMNLNKEEIVQRIVNGWARGGWPINEDLKNQTTCLVRYISHIVKDEPLGTIFEKRGNVLQPRTQEEV